MTEEATPLPRTVRAPTPLEALARAYDQEDAAQRGEPDPWDYDDGNEAEKVWRSERITCAAVAIAAYERAGAALGTQPVPVVVKGLEWGTTSYGTPEVHTVVGVYRINNALNGGWSVVIGREILREESGRENFATVEAAQAAAQADYEARIRSALAPAQAVPGDMDPTTIEACAKIADAEGHKVADQNADRYWQSKRIAGAIRKLAGQVSLPASGRQE
ncbi:hypothetical protein [Mesorhizobium sp.]|uniref:hypothetical protein n=1 Tax=Mesorhizobium sp. TaxID=1871066 RepID=UPI000FEA9E05|nr:hypothetical protein [Mesorhizobium sp.]RWN33449.1 MAG: hypothetical protein EOR95_16010 [Mesorhizobium sp.]